VVPQLVDRLGKCLPYQAGHDRTAICCGGAHVVDRIGGGGKRFADRGAVKAGDRQARGLLFRLRRPHGRGAAAADGNPQRPEYWYFCANPEGYYPYIQDCDNWQQEPSQGGAPPGDYPEYQDPDFRGDQ